MAAAAGWAEDSSGTVCSCSSSAGSTIVEDGSSVATPEADAVTSGVANSIPGSSTTGEETNSVTSVDGATGGMVIGGGENETAGSTSSGNRTALADPATGSATGSDALELAASETACGENRATAAATAATSGSNSVRAEVSLGSGSLLSCSREK